MSQRSLEEFGAYRKAKERRPEYVRFLDFARGSARETRGRHQRMISWLDEDIVHQRSPLADEIVGILTATIERLRSQPSSTPTERLHEEAIYGT